MCVFAQDVFIVCIVYSLLDLFVFMGLRALQRCHKKPQTLGPKQNLTTTIIGVGLCSLSQAYAFPRASLLDCGALKCMDRSGTTLHVLTGMWVIHMHFYNGTYKPINTSIHKCSFLSDRYYLVLSWSWHSWHQAKKCSLRKVMFVGLGYVVAYEVEKKVCLKTVGCKKCLF